MTVIPRMPTHVRQILAAMAQWAPGSAVSARELLGAAGVLPGMGYPVLHRLCDRGLLARQWEDIDPVAAGRPRGCRYTLTLLGRTHSMSIVDGSVAARY